MSQLIQMRRRIQTIETIHKITNAMRLIAMSGHTRLKHKEELVTQYNSQIEELYGQIRTQIPTNFDPLANRIDPNGPELIILAGSQKGLCGNFNANVFNLFDGYTQQEAQPHIIAIGRRAEDFVKDKHYSHVIQTFSKFNTTNINEIVSSISEIINNPTQSYSRISIVSNVLKTFFAQRPVINQLLPLILEPKTPTENTDEKQKTILFEDYMWEQPPQSIIKDLAYLYLTAKLHAILFQSLLSEQAARFLSMDNSTRNAESLLELSKIQYNKLRQAKITKEINELVGSMSNN
jgi:F-type H+-transporting ATPase subunit gamma